jgi:uncharacterized protein (DUF2236 family)
MSLEMRLRDGRRQWVFHTRPLRIAPSADGLFAPQSVIRRVMADASVGLGSATALLLQLAHPSVAAAVHDHSDYANHPLDRLTGTLYAANTVVFGSRAEAEQVRRTIRGLHARVVGPGYRALDPVLVAWVNATLIHTAVNLYQRTIRPLSADERDEIARDGRLVGEVFGCPVDQQPATWATFSAYWDATVAGLEVSDTARQIAGTLFSGQGLPLRPAWMPPLAVLRAVTNATLPRDIRRQYGLPWSGADRALARVALGSAQLTMPHVPGRWRRLGPELLRSA